MTRYEFDALYPGDIVADEAGEGIVDTVTLGLQHTLVKVAWRTGKSKPLPYTSNLDARYYSSWEKVQP